MDVEKIKRVDETPSVVPLPPMLQRVESVDREKSTLAKADNVVGVSETRLSKPALEKPKNAVRRLLQTIERSEKVTTCHVQLSSSRMDQEAENIKRAHLEEGKKLQEAADLREQMEFWGILTDVGNLCSGAVSATIGYSILSSATPVIGGMLIGAGVLSIGNVAMQYTGGWDWVASQFSGGNKDFQQQLTSYLPAATGVLSSIMAIGGTCGAWYFGTLTQTSQVLTILETAGALAQGAGAGTNAYFGSKDKWLGAELSLLHSMARFYKLHLDSAMDGMKEFYEHQNHVVGETSRLLRSIKQQVDAIHQIV